MIEEFLIYWYFSLSQSFIWTFFDFFNKYFSLIFFFFAFQIYSLFLIVNTLRKTFFIIFFSIGRLIMGNFFVDNLQPRIIFWGFFNRLQIWNINCWLSFYGLLIILSLNFVLVGQGSQFYGLFLLNFWVISLGFQFVKNFLYSIVVNVFLRLIFNKPLTRLKIIKAFLFIETFCIKWRGVIRS